MPAIPLRQIAYARSGDKGAGANIGIIARSPADYDLLVRHLTAQRVAEFFKDQNPGPVRRFELPNLHALNFILPTILDGGGSLSLKIDAQGKSLGQQLLEVSLELPVASC